MTWLAENALALVALLLSALALWSQHRRRIRIGTAIVTTAVPGPDGSVTNSFSLKVTVINHGRPVTVSPPMPEPVAAMQPGQGLSVTYSAEPIGLRIGVKADHLSMEPRRLEDGAQAEWFCEIHTQGSGLIDAEGYLEMRVKVNLSTGKTITSDPFHFPVEPRWDEPAKH